MTESITIDTLQIIQDKCEMIDRRLSEIRTVEPIQSNQTTVDDSDPSDGGVNKLSDYTTQQLHERFMRLIDVRDDVSSLNDSPAANLNLNNSLDTRHPTFVNNERTTSTNTLSIRQRRP